MFSDELVSDEFVGAVLPDAHFLIDWLRIRQLRSREWAQFSDVLVRIGLNSASVL
jgi:hypothetical protein